MSQRETGEFQSSHEAEKLLNRLKKSAGTGKRINPKVAARINEVAAERDRLRAKGK